MINKTIDDISIKLSEVIKSGMTKSDLFDAIYDDRNIFSTKHPSMRGTSTAASYKNTTFSDMKTYTRSAHEGYFYMGQFRRGLMLTRVSDLRINAADPLQNHLMREFEILETEARRIIKDFFKDQIVLIYRILPTGFQEERTSSNARASSDQVPYDGTWSVHEPDGGYQNILKARYILPRIAICPILSSNDLLYPDGLELSSGDQKIWGAAVDTRNYAEFNCTEIICDTIEGFENALTDGRADLGNYDHMMYRYAFVHRELLNRYLNSNNWSFWAAMPKVFRDDMYFLQLDERTMRAARPISEGPTGEGDKKVWGIGADAPDHTPCALVSLSQIIHGDTDIIDTIQPFDHVKRRNNKKLLCEACPMKLLCLLSSGDTGLPIDINVCRSVAISSAFTYASKKLNRQLTHDRILPLLLPAQQPGHIVMTRACINLAVNYTHSTEDLPPEDWLVAHTVTGTIVSMAKETLPPPPSGRAYSHRNDYMKDPIALSVHTLFNPYRTSSVDYINQSLPEGLLSDTIGRQDLSAVRTSNNAHPCNYRAIYELPSLGKIAETAGGSLPPHSHAIPSDKRERLVAMLKYISDNEIAMLKYDMALSCNTSALEGYNNVYEAFSKNVEDGKVLRLNTKMMGDKANFLRSELYTLTFAALLNAKYADESVDNTGLGNSRNSFTNNTIDKLITLSNNASIVESGEKLKHYYQGLMATRGPGWMVKGATKYCALIDNTSFPVWISCMFDVCTELFPMLKKMSVLSTHYDSLPEDYEIIVPIHNADALMCSTSSEVRHVFDRLGISEITEPVAVLHSISQRAPNINISNLLHAMIALISYSDGVITGDSRQMVDGGTCIDQAGSLLSLTRSKNHQHDIRYPIEIIANGLSIFEGVQMMHSRSLCAAELKSEITARYKKKFRSSLQAASLREILSQIVNAISAPDALENNFINSVLSRLESKQANMRWQDCLQHAEHVLPQNANTIHNTLFGGSIVFNNTDDLVATYGNAIINTGCFTTVTAPRQLFSAVSDYRYALAGTYVGQIAAPDSNPNSCLTQNTAAYHMHISMSENQCDVNNSVIDLLMADVGNRIIAFKNIKSELYMHHPDCNDTCLSERLCACNIWQFDYAAIKDIRMCLDKGAVTRMDSRSISLDSMPSEFGARASAPLSAIWQNISTNTSDTDVKSIALSELLRHKAIIADIITEKQLTLFPDYDFDFSYVESDISTKKRHRKRVQLRHVMQGKQHADSYSHTTYTAQRLISQHLATNTGLVTKVYDSDNNKLHIKNIDNIYQALDTDMHLVSREPLSDINLRDLSEGRRAKVLTYQRGVLKDFIVEDLNGETLIYWHLHGDSDVENVVCKYHGIKSQRSSLREHGPRLESGVIRMIRKGMAPGTLKIIAPCIGIDSVVINEIDLHKYMRVIIMHAMRYTYAGLFTETINNSDLMLSRVSPIKAHCDIMRDPMYKLVPYTVDAGDPSYGNSFTRRRHKGYELQAADIIDDQDIRSVKNTLLSKNIISYEPPYSHDTIANHECISNDQTVASANVLALNQYTSSIYRQGAKEVRNAYAPYLRGLNYSDRPGMITLQSKNGMHLELSRIKERMYIFSEMKKSARDVDAICRKHNYLASMFVAILKVANIGLLTHRSLINYLNSESLDIGLTTRALREISAEIIYNRKGSHTAVFVPLRREPGDSICAGLLLRVINDNPHTKIALAPASDSSANNNYGDDTRYGEIFPINHWRWGLSHKEHLDNVIESADLNSYWFLPEIELNNIINEEVIRMTETVDSSKEESLRLSTEEIYEMLPHGVLIMLDSEEQYDRIAVRSSLRKRNAGNVAAEIEGAISLDGGDTVNDRAYDLGAKVIDRLARLAHIMCRVSVRYIEAASARSLVDLKDFVKNNRWSNASLDAINITNTALHRLTPTYLPYNEDCDIIRSLDGMDI